MNAFALEPIEKAPLADLKKLQLQRLRWTLQHAYDHVPHYRRKFDAAGVKPEDCRSLSDLARFPFTTKADLRETYPFGMFAVPMDRIVRIHASSGTTGKPTVVGYSAKDIDTWAGVMARSIRAAGARPGDKVHVAYGYGLFTGGLGAHYGAERLGLAVIPLGGGMTERQVQLIADFKPEIIMVTPSYMLAIADEMERQGIDPAKCSLRLGIFGAEPWTNEMRANIENRLSMEAFDLYGLSEVIGPGVAQECAEAKDGLTIWEDHFYPEVVDAASGKPLADGEKGELILTSLTKEALPPDAPAARDRARHAPHGESHRPLRRHADHPRRQPVPVADRGADPQAARAQPALRARDFQGRAPRPPDRPGGRKRHGDGQPAAQHQGLHRHYRRCASRLDRALDRQGLDRALDRQGEARHRQAAQMKGLTGAASE